MEEEKNILINQANMYLKGMSFREIAKKVGQSHVTVRDNLTNKLKNMDPSLHSKVQAKVAENSEKTIKDSEVRNRVLASYKLLVEENKTIAQIANALDVTENVTYRDLTSRLTMLHEAYPEFVTSDMLTQTKIVLQKHSLSNIISVERVDMKVLSKMYPSEDKRYRFIARCALTFGLRSEALSELFGIDKKEIEEKTLRYLGEKYTNIVLLYRHGMKEQNKAKREFMTYFGRLYQACLNSPKDDKQPIIAILEELSDKKVKFVLEKRMNNKILTDEDIAVLARYQVKYMMGPSELTRTFGLERNSYSRRVRNLEGKYPELVSEFDYLCDFWKKYPSNVNYVGR